MRFQIPIVALALVLAACSTVDRETGIPPNVGDAFALVVADGMSVTGSLDYSFTLRRVDVASSKFQKDFVSISFSGMGTMAGNEFKKPDTMETTLRFGGKALAPGDYAFIQRIDRASYGSYSSMMVNCFAKGSPVFRLKPGTLNVLGFGSVKGGATYGPVVTPETVQEVMAGYPNMTAPIQFAELLGVASFDGGKTIFGSENCRTDGNFVLRTVPVSPAPQAKDP